LQNFSHNLDKVQIQKKEIHY